MSVTTKDLARICGVSRATVTRALHNTGSIKESTKNKIIETAKSMGYQPDMVARSLVKGTSNIISVVVVELRNQYFAKIIDVIEKKAKSYGYMLTISLHEDDKKSEIEIIQSLAGYRTDGFILICANKSKEFEKMLQSLGKPYVILGYKSFMNSTTIGADEYKLAYTTINYIIAKGYKEIVFVAPSLYDRDGLTNSGHGFRRDGYCDALKKKKLVSKIIFGEEDYIEQILQYLNENKGKKPAFFCSGDVFAVDVIVALTNAGYELNKDYGIMGCDKIDDYQKMWPKLTTVDNNIKLMGDTAVTVLLGSIEGNEEIKNIEIPITIIEGDTL